MVGMNLQNVTKASASSPGAGCAKTLVGSSHSPWPIARREGSWYRRASGVRGNGRRRQADDLGRGTARSIALQARAAQRI